MASDYQDLDNNKQYELTYEYVHFVATRENCSEPDHKKRKVFKVEKTYRGYPHDIMREVKYYMGHYGAIHAIMKGEINEITNEEDRVWS